MTVVPTKVRWLHRSGLLRYFSTCTIEETSDILNRGRGMTGTPAPFLKRLFPSDQDRLPRHRTTTLGLKPYQRYVPLLLSAPSVVLDYPSN